MYQHVNREENEKYLTTQAETLNTEKQEIPN